jgi:mono/diheme cytochrome c family protein
MRLEMLHVVAIGLSGATATSGLAQEGSSSIASGRKIAETWCAACHEIDLRRPEKATAAPSFAQIARLPSTTPLALRVFLQTSHQAMPNYQLTRQESDDIIAFILSLKAK